MKNKTVIRKEKIIGEFTLIHHSIIKDKNLSPNGFRLLISILSDSDTKFNLSQTLYTKRLDITKQTFYNAIENLEKCGYLRKKKNKIKSSKNYYIISEYGNLNNEEVKIPVFENNNQSESDINISSSNDYSNEFLDYINSIEKLISNSDFTTIFNDVWLEELNIRTVKELKKQVTDYLKKVYNEYLALAKNPEKYPKALNDYKEWLKKEIYENHNLILKASSKWAHLSLIKYKKKFITDHETTMEDYYENPKD